MPVTYLAPNSSGPQLRRPYYPGHRSSYLELIPEEELEAYARMAEIPDSSNKTEPDSASKAADGLLRPLPSDMDANGTITPGVLDDAAHDYLSATSSSPSGLNTPAPSTPGGGLHRSGSTGEWSNFETFGPHDFPPVDRLTIFDILENLALPQRLERMQNAIHDNAEKLRRQRARLARSAVEGKNNLVGKWKKGGSTGAGAGAGAGASGVAEEQLDKYRRRMRDSVDRLNKRWNAARTVTMKEKISFVTAVLNIFISGYLIGAFPQYFHYWYTAQLAYFMPIRWYNYHKIGFHYFLADLCYFVNFLLILTIWFFPQSKRLLISTYCLAFGNNAVAIAMWRNSLVFHSLDKVTSLFIHIMPCVTLHVLVHLIPVEMQRTQFPAIYTIKYSPPSAPEHYRLSAMIIWATLPYAIWQLSYHFLITVRKRSKIAAGRPTSFTWLRKSYAGNFLGRFVLNFPEQWQESVFMAIQYTYATLTMLPCPLWFWYRWASAGFLAVVFTWASWNGATYYIDVFGRRMEKELEQLRKEVQRMGAKSPEMMGQDGTGAFTSPVGSPVGLGGQEGGLGRTTALDLGPAAQGPNGAVDGLGDGKHGHSASSSIDGEIKMTDGLTMISEVNGWEGPGAKKND